MLEEKLLESITAIKTTTKEEKDPIDNLVYKSFVKRFNEKYENQLNEGQKSLLTKYVTSFVDDGLELKMAMNEEIGALKTRIKSALAKPVVAKDKDLLAKTNKVIEILEDYKNKEVDLVMVEEVLKMQSLIEEIENDAN